MFKKFYQLCYSFISKVKMNFYFHLVPPFFSPKWNRYFSACETLPNSSCHFGKDKSIFLQILHQSSVTLNTTLLYILAQTLYTLVKNSPLKCKFLRHSSAWVKICQIVVSILKRQVNFSSNFSSFFIVMINNSSVNLKLIHFLPWIKEPHQSASFQTCNCSDEN